MRVFQRSGDVPRVLREQPGSRARTTCAFSDFLLRTGDVGHPVFTGFGHGVPGKVRTLCGRRAPRARPVNAIGIDQTNGVLDVPGRHFGLLEGAELRIDGVSIGSGNDGGFEEEIVKEQQSK